MNASFTSTTFTGHRSIVCQTRWTALFLVSCLAVLTAANVAKAGFDSGLIDFDFNWDEIGWTAYGPGAAAIGSSGDLWNSVSTYYFAGEQKEPISLYDVSGNPTSVKWFNLTGGGVGAGVGGTYGKLVDVSTYMNSATITGLTPNGQYSLYLYGVYWSEVISVNGVNFTVPGIRYGDINSLTIGNQYDVHTVTADSAGTLTFEMISAENGTPYISSWQITPVPEPGTLSLLGLGVLAAAVLRRRA
jgi:hypothetical protein